MRYLDVISKKYDHYLLAAVVLLCIVGTVMLFSASNSISLDQTQRVTATVYLQAHLKRLLVGIAMMFIAMMIDYRNLKIAAKYLLIGSIVLLLITKIKLFTAGQLFPGKVALPRQSFDPDFRHCSAGSDHFSGRIRGSLPRSDQGFL